MIDGFPAFVRTRLRVFDDGVALFDPVSWRTHVLSPEGLALLAELLAVAGDHPREDEPSALLARFAASAREGGSEPVGAGDDRDAEVAAGVSGSLGDARPALLELARIAIHLRGDGP
jgi:hypothetical protein